VVRHSVRLNGISGLAITKLDVLGGMGGIKVCTAYEIDGKREENFPASLKKLQRARPIYEEFDGWEEWGSGDGAEHARKGYDALPVNMKAYLDFVTKTTGVPLRIVGLGKERNETIDLRCRQKHSGHSFY
jgi:adenylosuccinate synthase